MKNEGKGGSTASAPVCCSYAHALRLVIFKVYVCDEMSKKPRGQPVTI